MELKMEKMSFFIASGGGGGACSSRRSLSRLPLRCRRLRELRLEPRHPLLELRDLEFESRVRQLLRNLAKRTRDSKLRRF